MTAKQSLTYFSVDYRSPPSGLGQIIFPGSKGPLDMILVTFKGLGDVANPFYKATQHFPAALADEASREWLQEIFEGYQVTHVYDPEMDYQMGMSQHLGQHYYPASIWSDITWNGKPKDSLFV
tara:strand:- start:1855 stop:2223 length:369 start_codon:yes stop_codon:yes gene_type:complete